MHRARAAVRQVALLIVIALAASGARAHELRPALAEISYPDGNWRVAFIVNLEALVAGIGPEHDNTNASPLAATYDAYRAMPPEELRAEFDRFAPRFLNGVDVVFDGERATPEIVSVIIPAVGDTEVVRDSFVTIGGALPSGAGTVAFSWDRSFGAVVFRTEYDENGEGFSAFLQAGGASDPFPVTASASGLGAIAGYAMPLAALAVLLAAAIFFFARRRRAG